MILKNFIDSFKFYSRKQIIHQNHFQKGGDLMEAARVKTKLLSIMTLNQMFNNDGRGMDKLIDDFKDLINSV